MTNTTREPEMQDFLLSGDPVVSGLVASQNYREAQDVLAEMLPQSEAVSGLAGLGTVLIVHDLGLVQLLRGDFEASVPNLSRALDGLGRILGTSDAGTLSAADSLGEALAGAFDHVRARELHARALEGREKLLGLFHWDTLTSAMNLAIASARLGMFGEARALFLKVRDRASRSLGERHPRTLKCLTCLGQCLAGQGDLAGAREALERSLALHNESLGTDHTGSMDAADSLAMFLMGLGEHGAARDVASEVLACSEERFGKLHQHSVRYRSHLGFALACGGDFRGAEEAFSEAAEYSAKLFGSRHPCTVTIVLNMFRMKAVTDGPLSVCGLYERTLESLERDSGPESPSASIAAGEFGLVLARLGELGRAAELLRRAVSFYERTLGPSHDVTVRHLKDLRAVLHRNGDSEEALSIFRRVLMSLADRAVAEARSSAGSLGVPDAWRMARREGDGVGEDCWKKFAARPGRDCH
ncbi:MAG: tetratricopeptide repeat protein [Deltaproteobacteria bacterium]|jgi:tetratricopeptide (TPR) repeat protein|nr:tetratricopeptide repeat protein [Deltaproteobacteria bacterium]